MVTFGIQIPFQKQRIFLGRLYYRYKRFLAKMQIIGYYQENIYTKIKPFNETVYIANTGQMRDVLISGGYCLLISYKGKYKYRWIAIIKPNETINKKLIHKEFKEKILPEKYLKLDHDAYINKIQYHCWEFNKLPPRKATWIGTDTWIPNKIMKPVLEKFYKCKLRSEVKCGNSRIDFYAESLQRYMEVKNVHWEYENKACFPDTISVRATKQLKDIENTKSKIDIHYCIQRDDLHDFIIAKFIDNKYAEQIKNMKNQNIEQCLGWCWNIDPYYGYRLSHKISKYIIL